MTLSISDLRDGRGRSRTGASKDRCLSWRFIAYSMLHRVIYPLWEWEEDHRYTTYVSCKDLGPLGRRVFYIIKLFKSGLCLTQYLQIIYENFSNWLKLIFYVYQIIGNPKSFVKYLQSYHCIILTFVSQENVFKNDQYIGKEGIFTRNGLKHGPIGMERKRIVPRSPWFREPSERSTLSRIDPSQLAEQLDAPWRGELTDVTSAGTISRANSRNH